MISSTTLGIVSRLDEGLEFFSGAESRIDVEEVLHTVAVISIKPFNLFEDWPEGCDTELFEVWWFALKTAESSAHKFIASISSSLCILIVCHGIAILGAVVECRFLAV